MVDALLATIDEPNPKIDRLWVAEADDQFAAYRSGEITAVDLENVLAKYRKP